MTKITKAKEGFRKEGFIVVYKHFNRYDVLNLSILSAIHFVGQGRVFCLDLYADEPKNKSLINLPEKQIYQAKTSFPSFDNRINALFFSEGYNMIYSLFQDFYGKIVCCADDHYFSTGDTLMDLAMNDFDFAWASWGFPTPYNSIDASILCFNPIRARSFFPLPVVPCPVDNLYFNHIVNTDLNLSLRRKIYKMKFRDAGNYKGDGHRVVGNDVETMKEYLRRGGIIT